jgi:hypothetical protein
MKNGRKIKNENTNIVEKNCYSKKNNDWNLSRLFLKLSVKF